MLHRTLVYIFLGTALTGGVARAGESVLAPGAKLELVADAYKFTEGPAADAFRAIARVLVEEAVPPPEMAGCSAHMFEAMAAALDAADAAEADPEA